MGWMEMVFRLNVVVTSLCIVIGLSASVTNASGDKSRSLNLIPLRSLDVMSTGSIAILPADNTYIHPGETTSCTVNKSAEHHLVHCRGKKQGTQITLTESADATTWIRTPSTICCISSDNEAPDILCTPPSSPSFLDALFPELSGLEQDAPLLSELSDLLQDDVFQSAPCASAEGCAFDTPSESDQRLTNISGMNMLKVHTEDKLFVCDQDGCNKSFTSSSNFARHKRTHTGNRPYVCNQSGCNRSFTQPAHLTAHKRIHTGITAHKRSHTGEGPLSVIRTGATSRSLRPFVCDQDGCGPCL
ncbi:C2H2-type zinc finger protein [Sansalvadorimonas verongulae]|nr:C2H2-type zinc finger protein [Sansalvadorimonas verongulae]